MDGGSHTQGDGPALLSQSIYQFGVNSLDTPGDNLLPRLGIRMGTSPSEVGHDIAGAGAILHNGSQ